MRHNTNDLRNYPSLHKRQRSLRKQVYLSFILYRNLLNFAIYYSAKVELCDRWCLSVVVSFSEQDNNSRTRLHNRTEQTLFAK